jgi:predicted SprT family Zn-dependent metalloprotease
MNIYTVERYARYLINKFKRNKKIGRKWKFAWNKRKRVWGVCDFSTHTIYVSIYHAEFCDKSSVFDTIRHEVAHAIAGLKAKSHGAKWKKACQLTRAKPSAMGVDEGDIPCKYVGRCRKCETVVRMFNDSPKRIHRVCQCGKKLKWEKNHALY